MNAVGRSKTDLICKNNIETYIRATVVQLAPGPDRIRVARGLAVEDSAFSLILILTALVSCDDWSS